LKRPAGLFSYEFVSVAEDEHGTWLYGATGSSWQAPHDSGTLPYDVLLLVHPDRWAVGWWVDDPDDPRVEIDICLPPLRTPVGWQFVDLELDPVRHERGEIEIEDLDEFDEACANGWIEPDHAAKAQAVAAEYADLLQSRAEPWGAVGWERLTAIRTK
jgi:hypothetical protein